MKTNNYLGLQKAQDNRETFAPVVEANNDVLFTLACQINGLKKEQVVNDLAVSWANEVLTGKTMQQVSEFTSQKKIDPEAKELAFKVVTEKVLEMMKSVADQSEVSE